MSDAVTHVLDTPALSGYAGPVVATHTAATAGLTLESYPAQVQGWNDLIAQKLIEWGRNPSALEDEGRPAPTPASISLASQLARRLRDGGCPPPTWVVPNTESGVTLQWSSGDDTLLVEIRGDCSVHRTFFRGEALVSDEVLPVG